MKKVKLSKRAIAWILGGTMLTGGIITGISLANRHRVVHDENSIGYEDINHILNWTVNPEDFVLFNVGDHDSCSTWFQDEKIRYCSDNDISKGLIIDSDATSEESIYDDVEYVKGLVKKYDIDFPVYLNIDKIITNDDLNIEMKHKIILDFLEKCSSNNIYVGVSGTDTNLCRLTKYCGISGYDAYLIMDKDKIEYSGLYNVYKDLDGVIRSKNNLSDTIRTRHLNDSTYFAGDLGHVVKEGEDILDISLNYGISVNELLDFNGLKREDISTGTVVRIPSVIDSTRTKEFRHADKPLRGCDMSYAQGEDSNWKKLSENFDFIILRSNHGVDADETFEKNAINCNQNDIPMGVYCYNDYCRIDCGDDMALFEKQQKKQANATLQLLKNKKVEYPVYLDIEHEAGVSNEILSKKQVKKMFDIWAEKISNAGYIPGIYCNQSDFRYLQSCVDYDISDVFEVWIAGGEQYAFNEEFSVILEDVKPSNVLSNDGVSMAQSTSSCVGAGAANSRGHLDIDFSNKDYSLEKHRKSQFNIKEFNRINFQFATAAVGTFVTIGGIGAAFVGVHAKKRKKHKTKRKIRSGEGE